MTRISGLIALASVFVLLATNGCDSNPKPSGQGSGGTIGGTGGVPPTGGVSAAGGVTGSGGVATTGGSPSGGTTASAGGTTGAGGTATTAPAAGGSGGADAGIGGATGVRDGGTVVMDAHVDGVIGSGGARTGGAIGTTTGGAGGAGGTVGTGGGSGGMARTGGVTGTGGAATGGATGTTPACQSDESSTCTSGSGPLGSETKCDFGGGDGNYDVTVELGGATASDTFVDAERYRRMLPQLAVPAGQSRRFAFTVNVRTPEGQPVQNGATGSVPGLQIYFRGPSPKVNAICHRSASKPLMLWIGGDSTVCDQDSTNYTGWAQRLPQFLQAPLSVANYADSGESSGSFLGSSAMFGAIKARWKSGDWFFVQMGHNDKTTTAATFKSNMQSYVTQAKAAGVNIVLVTPVARVGYALADQHVNSTGANLPQIIRDLGKSEGVPVIDLTVTTWNWIQTITPKDYFAADSAASGGYDHTHLGPKGADAVAGFVRDAIAAAPGIPALASYLR